MSYSDSSFDGSMLNFPQSDKLKWVTVEQEKDKKLYSLLVGYIYKNLVDYTNSYAISVLPSKVKSASSCCSDGDCSDSTDSEASIVSSVSRVATKIGYGQFSFTSKIRGEILHALHQKIGDPIGTNCGVVIYSNLVIFTEGSIQDLTDFFSILIEESEHTDSGTFTVFGWNIRYSYWKTEAKVKARPLSSVVLPQSTKSRLIQDLEKFLLPKTQAFYSRNGIPYRRSYLFYGLPGTGKTSMIQALAGMFHRNICYLMPTHPDMTDDSLRDAVNDLPDDAIVVFEDIDSLFAKDRSNKVSKSSLTFSGLLNALDGIGNPNGQIFILTTNLREQLDSALIRNGRVDLHVEFTYAVDEQMVQMWSNFYPDNKNMSTSFASSLLEKLSANDLQVTASGLQHFFVTQMESSAEQALASVDNIIADIKEHNSENNLKLLKSKEEKSDEDKDDNKEEEDDDDENNKDKSKKNKKNKPITITNLFTSACLVTAIFALTALHSKYN